jgi:hypothetical protein
MAKAKEQLTKENSNDNPARRDNSEREENQQELMLANDETRLAETTARAADDQPVDMEELEKYADQGLSKSAADNLVPLIYILQKGSPQVDDSNQSYLDGAKAGDIWLRNAPNPLIKSDDGLLFQPCYFEISWLEWIPRERGGGFVARHPNLAKAEQCPIADIIVSKDPRNPNKIKYTRPNGNEVIMNRNHIGYALNNGMALPYVIPMSGTGHTTSRTWMMVMNQRLTASGKSVPSWDGIYRMRTRPRTNQMGTWHMWEIKFERRASKIEFIRGKTLHEAFLSGVQAAETPPTVEDHADADNPM